MSHKKTYLYNFNLYEMFRIDKYIKTVDSRLVVAYGWMDGGMDVGEKLRVLKDTGFLSEVMKMFYN